MSETRTYPRHIKTDAGEIEFRLMSRADEAAVLEFAKSCRRMTVVPAAQYQPAKGAVGLDQGDRARRTSRACWR